MQPSLRTAILGFLLLVARLAGCVGELPPPPQLRVTSPERGMIQSTAGQVTVMGTALPGPNGSPVTQVTINKTPATVSTDGSFTAVVMVPEGATLLETIAISEEGGKAIDARAVHIGELRPVGSRIDHAVRMPAVGRVGDPPLGDQVVEHADDEQRMSLGSLLHNHRQFFGEGGGVETSTNEVRDFLGGQRVDDKTLGAVLPLQFLMHRANGLVGHDRLDRAVGGDH